MVACRFHHHFTHTCTHTPHTRIMRTCHLLRPLLHFATSTVKPAGGVRPFDGIHITPSYAERNAAVRAGEHGDQDAEPHDGSEHQDPSQGAAHTHRHTHAHTHLHTHNCATTQTHHCAQSRTNHICAVCVGVFVCVSSACSVSPVRLVPDLIVLRSCLRAWATQRTSWSKTRTSRRST